MSLLDTLSSLAGGDDNNRGGAASLVPALIEMVGKYPGGLSGLLQQLQQGGLGASWLPGWVPAPINRFRPTNWVRRWARAWSMTWPSAPVRITTPCSKA